MNRLSGIFALFSLSLFGQQYPTFTAVYEATLSAATGATTLQQAASPSRQIGLLGAQLYCSVACVFTLDYGTTATATLGTAVNASPADSRAATARVYTASDASAGTTLNKYVLGAGQTMSLTFVDETGASNTTLPRTTTQGITFRVASMTGDVKVTWMWKEQ